MSNAAIDANSRQTATATLKTDGVTIVKLEALSITGALTTTTTTSGAVVPSTFAETDNNGRISWFAVSENDPTVLVRVQCDSSGAVLIKII